HISNLTGDQPFSALAFGVSAHPMDIVPVGMASTPGWTALAENGDPSVLAEEWMDAGYHVVGTTAGGVDPGGELTVEFSAPKNGYVFWCAMLVSTNDGFTCGSAPLPKRYESTGQMTAVYDNGSEANTYAP